MPCAWVVRIWWGLAYSLALKMEVISSFKMFTFNRLHNIISQTTELFITVTTRISNLTKDFCTTRVFVCKDKFLIMIQLVMLRKKKIRTLVWKIMDWKQFLNSTMPNSLQHEFKSKWARNIMKLNQDTQTWQMWLHLQALQHSLWHSIQTFAFSTSSIATVYLLLYQ
jgi:hypothetical protein